MVKQSLFLFLIMIGLIVSGSANAVSKEEISRSKDWYGFAYEEDGKKVCYAISKPVKQEGNYSKRGAVHAYVVHRPHENAWDQVAFEMGYPTRKTGFSAVVREEYKLVTQGDKAWTRTAEADRQLIKAMKRGAKVKIFGTSTRGTRTKDTYSLLGFTKVYNDVRAYCKK